LASGKLSLAPAPTDVRRVIRQAVDMVTPTMLAKRLRFTDVVDADLGAATLDGVRLKQILGNLLANATKFTPDGGAVALRARRANGTIELEVADTGEGFAPDLVPHLFDRFWQADMGETRQHMGLGIGLALAKQLATLHGGTIEARSDGPGLGATFRVRIPWVEASDDDVEERRSSLPNDERPLANLVVLLVEDDAHTREAMRWMLLQAGATVVAVATCLEALDLLDADPPTDVVVSDLGLPLMSGYELIERIAERRRARGLPVPPACAVSAHAREVDRQRALTSGFDMYLAKPVTAERLIEAVTDLRDVVREEVRRG
jgi:CheY-like chemotaxis protein